MEDLKTEREVEVKLLHPLFTDTLGYPEDELDWARRVPMHFGRERRMKEADLVVKVRGKPVITVEAKSPTEAVQSHLGQVDSYAFHLQTPYSVITNGRQFVLRGYYSFNSRINVIDESVDGLANDQWQKVRSLISFANIQGTLAEPPLPIPLPDQGKIKDYRRFFRKLHNTIRDRDKLDPAAAFDELSKLLFLKAAEDEWRQKNQSKPVLTSEKIREWETLGTDTAKKLINDWFGAATAALFPNVFDDHAQINLAPATLAAVLAEPEMASFHVKGGDVDVKGRAFEEFLPSQLRGEGLGQFFTPRPIVNFMAELAGISIHDVIADFACGSGGFLIRAFEQMERGVEQLPAGTVQRMGATKEQLLDDIRTHQIFGIDAEPRAARTAKMNMLMWGDGRKVVRGNALDVTDHGGNPYELVEYDPRNQGSGCTVILANPPFGSKEKDAEILKRYVLGSKLQNKKSEKTEILFIEKGLKLLRPEGKMLIVLPQGLLSGANNARVRDFIHSEAEIRAVISLPTHTFVQSGVSTVNACIVYLQKFTAEKKKLYDQKTKALKQLEIRALLRANPEFNYPIFMGTAEFIGYEPNGRSIVSPDESTDLDLLLDDFAKQEELSSPNVDLFRFSALHYGEKSHRRSEQTVRGTVKGLKTSFVVQLGETNERLDPPFYLFKLQAGAIIASLDPLGDSITAAGPRFKPRNDDDLDREYPFASVSNDGKVSLSDYVKGETFKSTYRPKIIRHNDFVYNPMRINVGSIGIVPKELDGALTSPDYIVFRYGGNSEFLLSLLRSPFYRMYIDVVSTGSIRDRLLLPDLRKLCIPDVEKTEQAVVTEMVRRNSEEADRALEEISVQRASMVDRINGLIGASVIHPWVANHPAQAFAALAEQWRRETGFLSSVRKKVEHPAYRKIIEMGEVALPFIFAELRRRPAHWFEALEAITGANPVSRRGDMGVATQAWLKWARENGYEREESLSIN